MSRPALKAPDAWSIVIRTMTRPRSASTAASLGALGAAAAIGATGLSPERAGVASIAATHTMARGRAGGALLALRDLGAAAHAAVAVDADLAVRARGREAVAGRRVAGGARGHGA